MALTRLYYTQAEASLDDSSTSQRVAQSFVYGVLAFLLGLKTGTTGTSGAPPVGSRWTMDHSCDGTTAGTPGDAVNRWGGAFDNTKLVASSFGATPKSWAVLKSPTTLLGALGVPVYLVIGFQGADNSHPYLAASLTQPTGGTANVIPTAADQVPLWNSAQVFSDVTAAPHKMSYVTAGNGAFYVSISRTGQHKEHTCLGVWDFSGPEISDDNAPFCVFFDSNGPAARGCFDPANQLIGSNGYNTGGVGTGSGMGARDKANAHNPGNAQGAQVTAPLTNGSSYYGSANSNPDGTQEVLAADYYWVNNGITTSFKKGTLPDWFIANEAKATGLVDPPTGASELIFIGHLWLPNGGVPRVL